MSRTVKEISGAVIPPTPEQEEAARKTVCANAENAEEAAMFLDMLGLL